MDLFSIGKEKLAPLAERMRAVTLEEFVGQQHIVSKNSLLDRAIRADKLGSCIFFGPSGTGKTTLANIISNTTRSHFVKLNAVNSGVSDAKAVIEEARNRLNMYGIKTYLLLDECHRWSKAQSDSILASIEDGTIIFIGSTTENPYNSMTKAIVSRCRIFEFLPLSEQDIITGLKRALASEKGLKNYNAQADEDALKHFAWASAGDLRNALNALELAVVTSSPGESGKIIVDKTVAEQSIQKKILSVDESLYYDMISAFCKSLRGSSPEGALYWATRLIEAGCDPLLIFRRLIVHASEDVGMADSQALVVATQSLVAFQNIGAPEGFIPMCHAIIYVCTAPKSNAVVVARANAAEAVNKIKRESVPFHLRDRTFFSPVDTGAEYKYPHDYGGKIEQQYLPDEIKNEIFYIPSNNGREAELSKEFGIKKK